jgi:hypothetical protein
MAKNVKKQNSTGAGTGGGMNEDDFNNMYGTRFLSSDDVKKPTETVIVTVEKEIFDRTDGRSEAKALLHFKAFPKPCVCNKTNARMLADEYGKNLADWLGKPVLVRAEMTSFGGKPVKGIRVYPAGTDDMKGDAVPY